jgi:hypothetical protein
MQNGYALCTEDGLAAIGDHLRACGPKERDRLLGLLCIGVQTDAEITITDEVHTVTQAFCSALPVAYGSVPAPLWEPFARLVLDAAYEATMWSAVLNARRGVSRSAFLTRLGGGVFGNDDKWIDDALRRSLRLVREFDLDVKIVNYGPPSRELTRLVEELQ